MLTPQKGLTSPEFVAGHLYYLGQEIRVAVSIDLGPGPTIAYCKIQSTDFILSKRAFVII